MHSLELALSFGSASPEIIHGGLGRAHAYDNHTVKRCIGLTVSASIEPVPVGLAARCRNGAEATQLGQGRLQANPLRIVADEQQHLCGDAGLMPYGSSMEAAHSCVSRPRLNQPCRLVVSDAAGPCCDRSVRDQTVFACPRSYVTFAGLPGVPSGFIGVTFTSIFTKFNDKLSDGRSPPLLVENPLIMTFERVKV
jgi:hypothetical protein